MWARVFLDHPHRIGEGYWSHQRAAFGFAGTLMLAGLICLIHGLVPGLFQTAASRAVARLNERMAARQQRAA